MVNELYLQHCIQQVVYRSIPAVLINGVLRRHAVINRYNTLLCSFQLFHVCAVCLQHHRVVEIGARGMNEWINNYALISSSDKATCGQAALLFHARPQGPPSWVAGAIFPGLISWFSTLLPSSELTEHRGIASVVCLHVALSGLY
jgi:hypothetical protein